MGRYGQLLVGAGVRVLFMCMKAAEKFDCTCAARGKPGLGHGTGEEREKSIGLTGPLECRAFRVGCGTNKATWEKACPGRRGNRARQRTSREMKQPQKKTKKKQKNNAVAEEST